MFIVNFEGWKDFFKLKDDQVLPKSLIVSNIAVFRCSFFPLRQGTTDRQAEDGNKSNVVEKY